MAQLEKGGGPFWFIPKSLGPSMPPGSYLSEDMFLEQTAPTEWLPHACKRIFLCPYGFRMKSRMGNMMSDQTKTVLENLLQCCVLH